MTVTSHLGLGALKQDMRKIVLQYQDMRFVMAICVVATTLMFVFKCTQWAQPSGFPISPSPEPNSVNSVVENKRPDLVEKKRPDLLLSSTPTCLNCSTPGLCDFIAALVLHTPSVDASSTLEYVVRDHPEWLLSGGSLLEFGVYSASSLRKIATNLPDRTAHGFDSFEGLPEAWQRQSVDAHGDVMSRGTFAMQALPDVPSNVVLHKGWFEQTLPTFPLLRQPIALLHVDCDLYSSTKTIFEYLGPSLVPGSVIVFDELLDYPGYENHEIRALFKFLTATRKTIEILGKTGDARLCPVNDRGGGFQSVAVRIH